MSKALKHMMVAEYTRDLQDAGAVIILDPGPMSVEKSEAFRKDLREQAGGARLKIIHNRTARRALEETLYGEQPEALDEPLRGRSAIVFGGESPILVAKVVRDWRRKFKALKVKGGVALGEILDANGVAELADMPSLPELRGMLASAIIGSARGIAASLEGVYGGLARVIQAHIDEQGGVPDEALADAPVDDQNPAVEPEATEGGEDAPAGDS